MIDISTILWLIAGFAFILFAGALLGAGSENSLTGLFPQNDRRDWPRGVQEADVPRFAVEHLDALRPTQGVSSQRDVRHAHHSAHPA